MEFINFCLREYSIFSSSQRFGPGRLTPQKRTKTKKNRNNGMKRTRGQRVHRSEKSGTKSLLSSFQLGRVFFYCCCHEEIRRSMSKDVLLFPHFAQSFLIVCCRRKSHKRVRGAGECFPPPIEAGSTDVINYTQDLTAWARQETERFLG